MLPTEYILQEKVTNFSTWWKSEVLADKCNTQKTDADIISMFRLMTTLTQHTHTHIYI
jgi:hypothetical protein